MLSAIYGDPLPGIRVLPLHSALQEGKPDLQAILEALEIDQKGQGFSALNTATLDAGLLIEVDEGVDAGDLLLQWGNGRGEASALFNSRVVLVLGRGARLQLVEQYENMPDEACVLNVVMQHSLAEDAELSLTRIQQQSASSILVTRTDVSQSANSRFHFTGLDLGEGLSRHDVTATLLGHGSSCALNGACMSRGQSHVDHHYEAAHIAGDCQSSQLFRAVAKDRGRVVFNGKVHVYKGADGTDARQSSAGLLLSKLAEIDAKPELEIYADEVIASHGATVGQLDEEALFYMRSRGLDLDAARNLLTMAFCRSVTDQLPVAALREPMGERMTRSLEAGADNG
jgi:Fe-S cluster assembly protein SufD